MFMLVVEILKNPEDEEWTGGGNMTGVEEGRGEDMEEIVGGGHDFVGTGSPNVTPNFPNLISVTGTLFFILVNMAEICLLILKERERGVISNTVIQ